MADWNIPDWSYAEHLQRARLQPDMAPWPEDDNDCERLLGDDALGEFNRTLGHPTLSYPSR